LPNAVAATDERAVVEAFDCFSTWEDKQQASLRDWAAAGPDGAAWNAEGAPLRCAVRLRSSCAGALALRLRGNSKRFDEREIAATAGENALELSVPTAVWEKALEASPGPYSVLLLSISGFVSCSVDAGGRHLPFADAFLAGFSGGE